MSVDAVIEMEDDDQVYIGVGKEMQTQSSYTEETLHEQQKDLYSKI